MESLDERFNNKKENIKRNANICEKLFSVESVPLTMSIFVTNRCTLKCKHCFNHNQQGKDPYKAEKNELTIEQFEKISKSMGTFMKCYFSGGEPFIRKDLYKIVLMFAKNNKLSNISLSTNGQDTEGILKQLELILNDLNENTQLSLGFSLDGFEEFHDQIRGKGTFSKSIKTWEVCKQLQTEHKNFKMYTCSTINTINQEIMASFLDWCIHGLRTQSVALLKTRQSPRAGDAIKDIDINYFEDSMKVIEKNIKRGYLGRVDEPYTYINLQVCKYVYSTILQKKRTFECFAGKFGGYINYDGDVGVCEVLEPFANLKDYNYDFSKLWSDNASNRNFAKDFPDCALCTHETEGIIPSLFFGENDIEII